MAEAPRQYLTYRIRGSTRSKSGKEVAMATPQELVQMARNAIGAGDSDADWRIVPSEHARMFEATAPTLAANLRDSRRTGLAEIYEELNAKGIKARDDFKSIVSKANTAVFSTASLA